MLRKIHVPNCLTGGSNTQHVMLPIKESLVFTNKNKSGRKNVGEKASVKLGAKMKKRHALHVKNKMLTGVKKSWVKL